MSSAINTASANSAIALPKHGTVRAPGNGRKARRKRRLEAQQRGDDNLFRAPFLHGNTLPSRLRLVDKAWKLLMNSNDAAKENLMAIDVGIGDHPETTLEWKKTIEETIVSQSTKQTCHLIGTEVDRQRLHTARETMKNDRSDTSNVSISFEWSGTDFKLPGPSLPHFVRAMNVLRDYHIHDTCVALHKLDSQLNTENGILIEGSTNSTGSIAVALVLIKHENGAEGSFSPIPVKKIIFGIDFENTLFRDADTPDDSADNEKDPTKTVSREMTVFPTTSTPPQWFQSTLPRLWRHCCGPESKDPVPFWTRPMAQFLASWHQIGQELLSVPECHGKTLWRNSIEQLSQKYDLCVEAIEEGVLIWENPEGLIVPAPKDTLGESNEPKDR